MKRVLDLLVSSASLFILAPLILLLCCLVGVFLGRPIFFRQTRPGKSGAPFVMYKFRTMTSALNEKGELLPDAMRLTPLGAFLRKTSLDELPELWNVIKGDMSLVGPRPLLMEYLPLYDDKQLRRHDVRPGITGWAQINGRNAISWEDKFRLDVWYVENRSLKLDLKILFITLKKVLLREGISSEGHATTEYFKGNSSD